MADDSKQPPTLNPEEMTAQVDVRRPLTQPGGWQTITLYGVLAALLLLAYLGMTGRLQLGPDPDSFEGKAARLKEEAAKNAAFGRDADSVANRLVWNQTRDQIVAADKLHGDLAAQLPQLLGELEALQSDDAGRRIATRDEWVAEYLGIAERPRVSAADLAAAKRDLDDLLPVCTRALAEQVVVPCSETLQRQSAQLHERLAAAAPQLAADLRALAALRDACRDAVPAGVTLAEAVEARRRRREQDLLAKIAQERADDETRAAAARLAAEKKQRDLEEATRQAEERRRLAEQQAERDRQEAEARAAEEKRQRGVRFDQNYPGVAAALTPFTAKGRRQLNEKGSWIDADPAPISWRGLQASPFFADRQGIWYDFAGNLARNRAGGNDRLQGAFPQSNYEAQAVVERVHRFLRDYGDIMVDRGLLAE